LECGDESPLLFFWVRDKKKQPSVPEVDRLQKQKTKTEKQKQ
jgi:hypothetical protein